MTNANGMLIALTMVFTAADACADATWNAAVDGDWRTDSNWVDSIAPSSAGRTYITNAAAAYTVTLGSGSDVTTAGLKISGKTSSSYQAKLNITDTKLIVDGAKPTVSYGAVTVGSGAELEIKNAAGMTVDIGGKLEVNGGSLVMTNGVTGALAVGNKTWLTGGSPTFSVKSGNAYFKGANTMMAVVSSNGGNPYGLIQMTGGKVEMVDTSPNHNETMLYVSGNNSSSTIFSMSGDSKLLLSQGGSMSFGWGVNEFKGNAKLRIEGGNTANYLYFAPFYSDNSRKVTVNVSDNATIFATDLRCFEFGKSDFRTTGTTGEFNISGGDLSFGICSMLGAGIGKYGVNVTGGSVDFKGYGVRIGTLPYQSQHAWESSSKDLANTTTVTVAGGLFSCSAEASHNNTPKTKMWGFIVGAGLVGRTTSHFMNGWVDGRINLQSGTVTNGCALKMFGVGRGIGTMTQTGGTYVGDSSENYYYNGGYWRYPDSLVLGAFGGEGIYDMRGGTAALRCPLFVGGTTLGIINRTDDDNALPANTEGKAVGTLKVSGGTMTVQYQSYVGYDGRGTIDVSGDGSLTFQSNLILTNNAANASTLKVTLADGAVPTFRIDGRLTVCDGAKLEVDASSFASSNIWAKVVDVRGGRTGSFDPANITLTGDGRIVQDRRGDSTGSIWLYRPRGMILTFR